MKVLVLGGTRFMGVATVERLLGAGHEVTIYNRGTRPNPWPGRVEALIGDRTPRVIAAISARRFDGVVDFSAYTAEDSAALLAVQGSVQRLVHISSGTVYRHDQGPSSERAAYGPEPLWGAYAGGKIDCERLLRRERATGLATTVLRFPWVLGPANYADRERFVLNRLLDGEEVLLPGDGQALQQFLSADQAAAAIVAALENFGTGWRPFNIAAPGATSLESFVCACADVAGVEPRLRPIGRGPTGTVSPVFDMLDCVFPFPNQNYLLDVTASALAGIAPEPVALDEIIRASLDELSSRPELRRWHRTRAEAEALAQPATLSTRRRRGG